MVKEDDVRCEMWDVRFFFILGSLVHFRHFRHLVMQLAELFKLQ